MVDKCRGIMLGYWYRFLTIKGNIMKFVINGTMYAIELCVAVFMLQAGMTLLDVMPAHGWRDYIAYGAGLLAIMAAVRAGEIVRAYVEVKLFRWAVGDDEVNKIPKQ